MKNPFEIAAALDDVAKWLAASPAETRLPQEEGRRLLASVRDIQRAVVTAAAGARGWGLPEPKEVPAEVGEADINRATSLKGAQLLSDYDILVQFLKMSPDQAKKSLAEMKKQKLEDLKLQVMAQNPMITGIAVDESGQPLKEKKKA